VFFVGKKNGKKRMVQNYRYFNEWTVKNNYSLPLFSNIVENIGTKRVFTKMDLWWRYNNVRIKERCYKIKVWTDFGRVRVSQT